MSTFDAEVFAQAAVADAFAVVRDLGDKAAGVKAELKELQVDVEATLAAIEVERDSRRARALRDDLDAFLPGRTAAILAAAEAHASKEIVAALESALTLTTRVAVITAKAFVASGGL